jgi:xylan 1,4-beta-xylosidase
VNDDISRRIFLSSATIAAAVGFSALLRAEDSTKFTYCNPIGGTRIRDCQIVRLRGVYYMTGTFPPFWPPARSFGVGIVHSTDLVHWSKPQWIIRPNSARWYQQLFWAPEIFPYRGKFFLTFNCWANGAASNEDTPIAVGLAVADSIMGPYSVITKQHPLTEGNDATIFLDTDGRVYLYSSQDAKWSIGVAGIVCSELDLEKGALLGAPTVCITKGQFDEWDGGEGVGVEGPSVFKRDGTYYLLYSSWRRGYEIGYATGKSPRGPWTKHIGNPIYGAQDPEACKETKSECTQSPDVPFGAVGHGSPFFGPDGRIWFGCHGIEQKGKGRDTEPHLVITPLEFAADGALSMALTWTPQTITIPHSPIDPQWRGSGTPASSP